MLENGDWINLHFGGEPDEWNVKPPLFIWCVAQSFKWFGKSAFTLRLPSALATILSFFFIFKIICLYKSKQLAFLTCLLLLSVKGIIGFHGGRTGDFDALFLAMLLGAILFFLKYIDFKQNAGAYFSAIFLGLAFMTKGWGMGMLMPGMLIYMIWRKKLVSVLKQMHSYLALGLFVLFPISWFMMIEIFGVSHSGNFRGQNAFETMFVYDILARFTVSDFEGQSNESGYLNIFMNMDSRFNLWNYFLYAQILCVCFLVFKKNIKTQLKNHKLLLLSLSISLPILLFLNSNAGYRNWYIAPAIPFLGIITVYLYEAIKKRFPYWKYVFYLLMVFTIGRQLNLFLNTNPPPILITENKELIQNASSIYKAGKTDWNYTHNLLELIFINEKVDYDKVKKWKNGSDYELVISREKFLLETKVAFPGYEVFMQKGEWFILRK